MKRNHKDRKSLKERLRIPAGVQDTLPILAVYSDGIFEVEQGLYSACWQFDDINFSVASEEDKKEMFLQYSEILNGLDTGAQTRITINNRRLNLRDFQASVLLPERDDGLEEYRAEYNQMLLTRAMGASSTVQDKYVTVTARKESIEEARNYFARVGSQLSSQFTRLGSRCTQLNLTARLRILHSFYRTGEESTFQFDFEQSALRGHSFKDYICPDSMDLKYDSFKLGNRFGRVLFLREYANFNKDDFVTLLTECGRDMMLSIDVIPIPTNEAVKKVDRIMLGIDTDIAKWQRHQNENGNYSFLLPHDMEVRRKETGDMLEDLTSRDMRMFRGNILIVVTADTEEELKLTTANLTGKAEERGFHLSVADNQQLEGMNSVLPIGKNYLDQRRTLTTEALATFIPFKVQEVHHSGGICYGRNVKSRNMIIVDRRQLLNGNSFILGVSGSGKSMMAKSEIACLALSTDADIIVIDPEREYGPLVRAMGGEVVDISATSKNHINAMDMSGEYGEEGNPLILKAQFIMSLCELASSPEKLNGMHYSIIDRCTTATYRYYQQGNYQGVPPTLQDFREELLKQPEDEAKKLALQLERFTNGTQNTFAYQTNVDTENRLLCYDVLDLGKQLMGVGMLIVLDSILNRITRNRAEGKSTYIFIDEIYLLYEHEYSALFLSKLWKRVRKYGGFATGISQNVTELLASPTASLELANSEFVILLNQAAQDQDALARLMNISNEQMGYINNSPAGKGLLKIGPSLVPFENVYGEEDKKTKLYRLWTTKQGEG